MKSLCLTLLTALFLPLSASAGTQLERIVANWTAWVNDSGITTSTISVTKGGKIILSEGININPQTVMPFASLSKAITAACTKHAIDAGLLAYTDTVGSLLGDTIDVNASNADITVAQLLSHGSGLAPDGTQKPMQKWLGRKTIQHTAATQTALGRTVQQGARNAYSYNNENYAILGRVIELATNQSYETYCAKAVLIPHGVTTANLTSIYGPFAAWGGWSMSADDYNRFLLGNFGPNTALGANPTRFPSTALNPNVNYGMGVSWRTFNQTHNYWHFGLLCFARKTSGGSYFAYYEGKVSVVVTHNKCLDWSQMRALDTAMVKAVYNR